MKHTPGPWTYNHRRSEVTGRTAEGSECVVAEIPCEEPFAALARPDGRLIAAAPDMEEALQALGAKPDGYCFCLNAEQIGSGHTGECRAAVAALAKAGSR